MKSEYLELIHPQSQQDMKDNTIKLCMEYLFIRGIDQVKYGTITKGFVSQYSLGKTNTQGLLQQILMHCPTKTFINNTMITRSATVISRSETTRTVRLTMREILRVFPSKILLATAVVIRSTTVITVTRGVLPSAPNGHTIRPCN